MELEQQRRELAEQETPPRRKQPTLIHTGKIKAAGDK
jgi:hypothetical protein